MAQDQVQQAEKLIANGQVREGRELLIAALRENRDNVRAWEMMAGLVSDRDEQIRCLQQVLRLDPANTRAQKKLWELQSAPPEIETPLEQIEDVEEKIDQLAEDLEDFEAYQRSRHKQENRQNRVIPVLVFMGSLLGSLLGVTADFGDTLDTIGDLRALTFPELCIVGSNTVLGDGIDMAQEWKDAFEQTHEVRVSIAGIGSVAGVEAAANGECVNILAMSEPMTDQQYSRLTEANVEITCAAEIGYDVIAFVTDTNNEIRLLQYRQLTGILNGEITNWGDIFGQPGEIFILARPGSGTTEYVLLNAAGYQPTADVPFPPGANYVPCGSNEDCLDQALSTPGSLYWVSAAWARTQPEAYLKVLPVLRGDERAINPLSEEADLTQYPAQLVRPLYFYVLSSPQGNTRSQEVARLFLEYVRGVQGQVILDANGFFTHFNRPREVPVPLPPGFTLPESGPRTICR